MHHIKHFRFMLLFAVVMLSSCHEMPEYKNTRSDSFDALWTLIDERYCFFEEKGIDWDSIYHAYQPRALSARSSQDFFEVCADMINELRDGHTNLSSPFATSYYRKWWSDYPSNFNERLIQEYYFNFNYRQLGSVIYGILPENIGYIRYPSFSTCPGAGNIDYILQYFATCDGLIFDVRDNGGGSLTNVEEWVCRFIDKRILAGYISHKTGPGHNDFSKPFAYYYDTPGNNHLVWRKRVAVLADRTTYSAANNFVSIMKLIPGIKIIGATTGGGSGMPFSSSLPNGWSIRFSACSILDADGQITEFGVDPSEGFAVNMDPEAALNGRDTLLDAAINYLTNQ